MAYFLVLFGPPGVGKGTQAQRLAGELQIPHISTGDIFREHLKNNSELGQRAREFMNAGKLVPDDLVFDIVRDRIRQPDAAGGFLLDGFPRTVNQAKALWKAAQQYHWLPLVVINLTAPDDKLVTRLSARRVCKACGAVYNLHSNPPKTANRCDNCGAELYQRPDDEPATIRTRLATYSTDTVPVLEFLRSVVPVHSVDGTHAMDQVTTGVREVIRSTVGS